MPRRADEAKRTGPRKTGWVAALAMLLGCAVAVASGPRWVTGPPYFTGPAGVPVVWYTTQVQYFTDPGDLSSTVNHAAADALVAAAAGAWNVPTSAMVMARGGALAEHVSSANTILGANGPIFPQDVQASNYRAIQIAVIYDSDGSITDLLMGSGASSPAECRQYGVTDSVDSITPAGQIEHAVLVLNGRCTGSAAEQQLQLQYQLERAFGRVLGLGWSQTNDNVFTQKPQPTYQQALHWPVMHPIDIVCGPYTYQCLPQPFTLRDDDVASVSMLYPMMPSGSFPPTAPAPGKSWTYAQASIANGAVSFPTGQGMQGVNVELQRLQGGTSTPEPFYDVSSMTGVAFQQYGGNPVTGPAAGLEQSMGSTIATLEGFYQMGWVPDIDPPGSYNGPMLAVITTEPLNPLYTGAYSVGPSVAGVVSPSGSVQTATTNNPLVPYLYAWNAVATNFASSDAASSCNTGSDGTEQAPAAVAAGGWWTDVLCARGHAAWSSFTMQASRSATLEVTALDESNAATEAKAMPLVGVWAAGDATGTLPTVAATPMAFNGIAAGMTTTSVSTGAASGFRFVIADARGGGRPDFGYQARVLYADSIQPAVTSTQGGQITIGGMGFRSGNEVLVNGVKATVTSWNASTIVAVAPAESAFATKPAGAVDVAVVDVATGGSTVMRNALTYGGTAPDEMQVVSAPSGTVAVGVAAALPFTVRVLQGDGVTPVASVPVTFAATTGHVQFGACGAATCVVQTDATGAASTTVTPTAYGAVMVQAAAVGTAQSASFEADARTVTLVQPVEYVAPGATVTWAPQAAVTENGVAVPGALVNWAGGAGLAVSPAASTTNVAGVAQTTATAGELAPGTQGMGQGCAWATVCAGFSVAAVPQSAWRLTVVSGAGQNGASDAFLPVVIEVTDAQGDPIAGAQVTIYQTVNAAEMPCPAHGACPISPQLSASTSSAVSDSGGLVSVAPMQLAGTAEVTNIAVAAGTQGFVALSLQQGP